MVRRPHARRARSCRARARQPRDGRRRYLRELPDRLLARGLNDPTQYALGRHDRDTDRARRARAGARATSSRTRRTRERLGSPLRAGGSRALPRPARRSGGRAARRRSRRSSARWPTPSGSRSSAAARCSASARCAGRRSRRRPHGRRSSEALAIFEELGARLWAEKARAELAPDQRPRARLGGADRDRTPRRRARRPGPHEQGDRRRALHGPEHGRIPPLARLPQARRPPRRARSTARSPSGCSCQCGGKSGPRLGFPGSRACAPEP